MKKTKLDKLTFPKAPTAISARALANVTGGGTISPCYLQPCVRPTSIDPCVRTIQPCWRPS